MSSISRPGSRGARRYGKQPPTRNPPRPPGGRMCVRVHLCPDFTRSSTGTSRLQVLVQCPHTNHSGAAAPGREHLGQVGDLVSICRNTCRYNLTHLGAVIKLGGQCQKRGLSEPRLSRGQCHPHQLATWGRGENEYTHKGKTVTTQGYCHKSIIPIPLEPCLCRSRRE